MNFTRFLKGAKSYKFGARTQQEAQNFTVSVSRSVFFLNVFTSQQKYSYLHILVPTVFPSWLLSFWILFIICCLKKYREVNNTSKFGSVSLHSCIHLVRRRGGATQLSPLYSQSLGSLNSPRTETSSSPNPVSPVFVFLKH